MDSLKILAFPETELRAVFDLAEELSRVGQDSPYYYELEDGYDIRTIQELLGHRAVKTTVVYTHVLNRGGRGDSVRWIIFDRPFLQGSVRTLGCWIVQPNRSEVMLALTTAKVVQDEEFL